MRPGKILKQVIGSMNKGLIDPSIYITHRINFSKVSDQFENLFDPKQRVIKAMIGMD